MVQPRGENIVFYLEDLDDIFREYVRGSITADEAIRRMEEELEPSFHLRSIIDIANEYIRKFGDIDPTTREFYWLSRELQAQYILFLPVLHAYPADMSYFDMIRNVMSHDIYLMIRDRILNENRFWEIMLSASRLIAENYGIRTF